ncbi:beta-galactosidase [Diaminobutyricimonas aerilata]|uniref:Beta-galactosidase n=1 Tax=Diaminobutyricimonas aerilata TaxID=1162967 RepID=A0A2M9CIQ5_9MICO|nr:beta-galactosidase [Diaminobutyricimonas aerilata]PJJ71748.1 beta-galactosidase [Diaminobutyricimonas aerilata]
MTLEQQRRADASDTQPDARPRRTPWSGARGLRYGGDYNPEQWPRETWVDDIALMREAGIDLVSVNIFSWALLEPREGEFRFDQLDDILDLLAGAGIDVDLGTPTAAPPAWFFTTYPEARVVTRDGIALGHGSRGMASPSSPHYRRAAAAITEQLARRYAQHPAVVMWHVHNEYGAPVSESYDEASVLAFREWLRRRYDTLDALNSAWGTTFWGQRYTEWHEIDAPRLAPSVVNPAQRLDFARFTSDALLACFVMERDIIRQHTPHLPVTTNFMATSCPSMDLWAWSREVDVVANDHYLTAERRDNHVLLAMDADLTRSLADGRPWMLMEHSTSAVNWQPRNIAKRAGELARNSISHLARGADAIMFFQFRASRSGAEKFHSAMLPHAGTGSRIWREVVALGDDLTRLAGVRGATTRAEVAVLWDWQSFWAQDLEWRPSVDLDHRRRIEAFYSALWHRDVTVDFAHPAADLSGYRVVLAPALYLVDELAQRNLRSYVEAGGTLVVSYFSGVVDEHDAVPAGPHPGGLRDVLGLVVEEFLPLRSDETVQLDTGERGRIWTDAVRTEGAEVVSRYLDGPAEGGPALTRHAFGAGTAWYVSTDLEGGDLDALLVRVLGETGVPFGAPDEVEVVVRHADDAAYTFAINHTAAPAHLTAPAGAVEMLTGEKLGGTLTVPPHLVRVMRTTTG